MVLDLSSLQKALLSPERAVRICGEKIAAAETPADEIVDKLSVNFTPAVSAKEVH